MRIGDLLKTRDLKEVEVYWLKQAKEFDKEKNNNEMIAALGRAFEVRKCIEREDEFNKRKFKLFIRKEK